MKGKYGFGIVFIIILLSLLSSGCSSKSPDEEVTATVTDFLNAVNDGEYGTAFNMYQGKDFLAAASIEMMFANKGIKAGSIENISIVSQDISDNLAVVSTECTVTSGDTADSFNGKTIIPVYFTLQNSDIGWIVTRVSFTTPLTLDNAETVDIEVQTTFVDTIVENAPIITVFAFAMLGTGVYLDRKDKAKKKQANRTIDTSGATSIQKETIVQYVKFVPAPEMAVGKNTTVEVWVKNFTQQPYDNFAIKAKFGTALEADNINLFFDTIAPGETIKRTWNVTPKLSGWASIEEPTVVFDYMGTKYIGVLDPVWIQVQ